MPKSQGVGSISRHPCQNWYKALRIGCNRDIEPEIAETLAEEVLEYGATYYHANAET